MPSRLGTYSSPRPYAPYAQDRSHTLADLRLRLTLGLSFAQPVPQYELVEAELLQLHLGGMVRGGKKSGIRTSDEIE